MYRLKVTVNERLLACSRVMLVKHFSGQFSLNESLICKPLEFQIHSLEAVIRYRDPQLQLGEN